MTMQAHVHSSGSLPDPPSVIYSHVHLYVDHVESVENYKELENLVLSQENIQETFDDEEFVPQNRDVIRQLICGLDFRVTGFHDGGETRSMLVTSKDSQGVQLVVTSLLNTGSISSAHDNNSCEQFYHHFSSDVVESFFTEHSGRQGVAVLAFDVSQKNGGVEAVRQRYMALHSNLIATKEVLTYNIDHHAKATDVKVFEVYAYYQDIKSENGVAVADRGTRLRFVERSDDENDYHLPLPGLSAISAEYGTYSQAAYCDHWVSNVVSRTGFIDTLQDILGFVPKVDFNAGVVAAGEAQIESTVSGNTSPFSTTVKNAALRDQSQIYLPINNALSAVGHVHGFIEEIGQGVQHIASRVEDLVFFVQQANDKRKRYGEGFTFLNIPRSYYGILTVDLLQNGIIHDGNLDETETSLSRECAEAIYNACDDCNLIDNAGAVNLEFNYSMGDDFTRNLESTMVMKYSECSKEFLANKLDVWKRISISRYSNLFKLLRDALTEETYLGIVENRILVDVQGGDLLFQIFTSNILQREPADESPFFEFIQRVCSSPSTGSKCNDDCENYKVTMKPGCGGFGIRNFLTLFLSIEVSKAMLEVKRARENKETEALEHAEKVVEVFTKQLYESNPILTDISDAMTAEGIARDKAAEAEDTDEKKFWIKEMNLAATEKNVGNRKLMECSSRYMTLMKQLREGTSQK